MFTSVVSTCIHAPIASPGADYDGLLLTQAAVLDSAKPTSKHAVRAALDASRNFTCKNIKCGSDSHIGYRRSQVQNNSFGHQHTARSSSWASVAGTRGLGKGIAQSNITTILSMVIGVLVTTFRSADTLHDFMSGLRTIAAAHA